MHDIVIGNGVIGTATTLLFQQKGHQITNISKRLDQSDTASVANGCYICPEYHPPSFFQRLHHYFKGNISFHSHIPPLWLGPCNKPFVQRLCQQGADSIQTMCQKENIPMIPASKGFFINGHRFNVCMKKKAQTLGACFIEDTIQGFHHQNGIVTTIVGQKRSYPVHGNVILATGMETTILAQQLGVSFSMLGLRGYSVTAEYNGKKEGSFCSKTFQTYFSDGNMARLTGFIDIGRVPNTFILKRFQELKTQLVLKKNIPSTALYHYWTGVRPYRNIPTIKRLLPYKNVYVNTGHGTIGLTCCLSSAYHLYKNILFV